ncbi:MAG: hypothetical protein FWE98_07560 [Oscillospiraceae bacterium]|nr:hypothetical protein [Oscillospiraceae bacterium]
MVAARTGCAILCIGHLTKSQTKAQYRGLGSIDIFNAIPSVLNLGKADEDVRVMVHNKSNFFETGAPIAFTLDGGFRWIGEYNITLDELLAGETSPRRNREREQAKQFLAELLADGPVDSEAVYALAEEQNIAPRTLERAKVEIGAKSHKPNGNWIWSMVLPPAFCPCLNRSRSPLATAMSQHDFIA